MLMFRSRLMMEVCRLLLAALLFVSGFAAARMQGEMGALALAYGGKGAVLCSGAAHADQSDEADAAAHNHECVLCAFAIAGGPPLQALDTPLAIAESAGIPRVSRLLVALPVSTHQARGPPPVV